MEPNGTAIFPSSGRRGLANYPPARVTPSHSRTLYISGTSSRSDDGTILGSKALSDGTYELDVKKQTVGVLRNIEKVIQEATNNQGGLGNIVNATVYLVSMKDYAGMNEEWNRVYPDAATAPARTCVAVKELPSEQFAVEIACTALI